MIRSALSIAALCVAPAHLAAGAEAVPFGPDWSASARYLSGRTYDVRLELEVPDEGSVPAWWLTPAAFSVDGNPLGERGADTVSLSAGARLSLDYDLSPQLGARDAGFVLRCDAVPGDKTMEVRLARPAPEGLDFMALPVEELGGYQVLLQTNRGDMLVELWPDVAPKHAQNFLDLAYTGFYDGILFHRVGTQFMIQGGCPNTKDPTKPVSTWGTGNGPRMLQAEFSDKLHERGVLSMARSSDPNSASSQFFVMTASAPGLNGSYSAFGRLVEGFETLDLIAQEPGPRLDQSTVRPSKPQRIERAVVVLAEPANEGATGE